MKPGHVNVWVLFVLKNRSVPFPEKVQTFFQKGPYLSEKRSVPFFKVLYLLFNQDFTPVNIRGRCYAYGSMVLCVARRTFNFGSPTKKKDLQDS
jgi:hypothetical protein